MNVQLTPSPKKQQPRKYSGFDFEELKVHIERIKDLVDGESILNHLGFTIHSRAFSELRGPCAIHGGDEPTAFRYKTTNNTFVCFTKHCNELHGSDIIGLIRAKEGLDFLEAVEYLSDFVGVAFEPSGITQDDIIRLNSKKFVRESQNQERFDKNVHKVNVNESNITEESVSKFVSNRSSYFIDRGFSKDTLDIYEVGTASNYEDGQRETIPIRDENGVFVGMSARLSVTLDDYSKGPPKYKILKDFNKNSHLYGLNIAKDFMEEYDNTIILVEGFTDCWSFWEAGVPISVCCMGTSLSNVQRYLLSKYAENCIIFFDGDSAGFEGASKVYKFIKPFVRTRLFYPEEGMEPSKYTRKELHDLIVRLL